MATCDIAALMEAGKCFGCLPPGQMQVLQLQLLCEIANSSTPFPATMEVTQGTNPWIVSGTVASTQSGPWDVSVNNFPASFGAVQIGGWSVSVDNFPANQPVSGTVTANQGTNPWVVSGTVAVSNFPATQPVSGTVTANQGTNPWVISGAVDTELPAAAALADGTANPTTPLVGSALEIFNGTTWDRVRSVSSANDTTGTGVVASGIMAKRSTEVGKYVHVMAELANLDAIADRDYSLATLGYLHLFNGTTWDRARGDIANGQDVDVTRLPAGTNLIGAVTPSASASTGTGTSHFRNTAVTNSAVAVKASGGKLHGYNLYNPGAALAYVHFYNVASGSVVVGTTTPIRSVALPSTATGTVGVEREFTLGVDFSTAISIAATTTPGGSTAPAVAIVCNVEYI